MKSSVVIKPITHKNENRIAVIFSFNKEFNEIAKTISGYKYSKTLKHFHFPNTKETLRKLAENFTAVAEVKMEGDFDKPAKKQPEVLKPGEPMWELNPEGKQKLQKFKYWMQSRRYSASTVNTYTDALKAFLKFYRHKPIAEINNEDIIVFNNDFVLKHNLSASYQNQVINAIKLFLRTIENTWL